MAPETASSGLLPAQRLSTILAVGMLQSRDQVVGSMIGHLGSGGYDDRNVEDTQPARLDVSKVVEESFL